jgi:hypothetical protein
MLLLSYEVLLQQEIKLASCFVCTLKVGGCDQSARKSIGLGNLVTSEVFEPYIHNCLKATFECLINSVAIMRQYSILLKAGNLAFF